MKIIKKKKKKKEVKNNKEKSFENKDNNKKGLMTREAKVVEVLPGNVYKVKLVDSKKIILGYASGNISRNYIKMIVDDLVIVELSVFDSKRCRIVFRK